MSKNSNSLSANSANKTPKDAFNWKAIPPELMHLAPDKEPVVKGSKLDTHLLELLKKCKNSFSCSYLSTSTELECSKLGNWVLKGYGGHETCKKYQIRCKSCDKTFTWATKVAGKPSLAEVVYSFRGLKAGGVNKNEGKMVAESTTSKVAKFDSPNVTEKGLFSLFDTKKASQERVGSKLVAKQVGVKRMCLGEDHVECSQESNSTEMEYTPTHWEERADSEDWCNAGEENLPKTADCVVEGNIVEGELVNKEVVEELKKLIAKLQEEVTLLKERKCFCGGKDLGIVTQAKLDELNKSVKQSYAQVVGSVKKQSGVINEKVITKRIDIIQKGNGSIDDDCARKLVLAARALEAPRYRKPEEYDSVFIIGLKKRGYGEMRKCLADIGIKRSKLLNMVWRGRVLEVITPSKYTEELQTCINAVSQTIRTTRLFNWESMFRFEGKTKSNVEVERLIFASSDSLIRTSHAGVKVQAKKSAKDAADAYNSWVKTTGAGKTDDSFTLVTRKKKRTAKSANTVKPVTKVAQSISLNTTVTDSICMDTEEATSMPEEKKDSVLAEDAMDTDEGAIVKQNECSSPNAADPTHVTSILLPIEQATVSSTILDVSFSVSTSDSTDDYHGPFISEHKSNTTPQQLTQQPPIINGSSPKGAEAQ